MGFEKVTETIKKAPSFARLTDLAAERLGGQVLFATDDFFAEKENLIKAGRGIFIADKYTDRGKWMDGWESRRKRTEGHDWCVVKLATTGIIEGFDLDTNFFLGNHPPFASVEGALIEEELNISDWNHRSVKWEELLPRSPLDPGSQNFYACTSNKKYSHVRLHIYPDGGVARLKVYGEVFRDWSRWNLDQEIDLAAAINGGKAIACNDMFFSSMNNLLMPGRGINMGDGWETKRNRTPGNRDWVLIQLAKPGELTRIKVDTAHFKGNYPHSFSMEGVLLKAGEDPLDDKIKWTEVVSRTELSADSEHIFDLKKGRESYSHIRLNIFPDGGISRLRVYGKISR